MTIEWEEFLFNTWKTHRNSKGWADIYECHDLEDREYLLSLEDFS